MVVATTGSKKALTVHRRMLGRNHRRRGDCARRSERSTSDREPGTEQSKRALRSSGCDGTRLLEAAHLGRLSDQRRSLSRRERLRLLLELALLRQRRRELEGARLRHRGRRAYIGPGRRHAVAGRAVGTEGGSAGSSACWRWRARTRPLRRVLGRLLVAGRVLRRRVRPQREQLDANRSVLTRVLIMISQPVHTVANQVNHPALGAKRGVALFVPLAADVVMTYEGLRLFLRRESLLQVPRRASQQSVTKAIEAERT